MTYPDGTKAKLTLEATAKNGRWTIYPGLTLSQEREGIKVEVVEEPSFHDGDVLLCVSDGEVRTRKEGTWYIGNDVSPLNDDGYLDAIVGEEFVPMVLKGKPQHVPKRFFQKD